MPLRKKILVWVLCLAALPLVHLWKSPDMVIALTSFAAWAFLLIAALKVGRN